MSYHPWFEPLWRRIVVALICFGWCAAEAWYGAGSLWFWLTLGAAGWSVWHFFLSGSYGRQTSSE